MARIAFKAKPEQWDGRVYSDDAPDPHLRIKVPQLGRQHCDMNAFRTHPRFGSYANSDLFPAMLSRIARDVAPNGYLRIDRLPDNVKVHAGAFLWNVHIEV